MTSRNSPLRLAKIIAQVRANELNNNIIIIDQGCPTGGVTQGRMRAPAYIYVASNSRMVLQLRVAATELE